MNIGIPKEIKALEGRVSLTPDACSVLVKAGHRVFLETKAGQLSGFSDDQYRQLGVNIVETAKQLYDSARLIVKVKEPVEGDLRYLTGDHLLFCYLHLAASADLLQALLKTGLTAIAFETVETEDHQLPLLTPMSAIAGRLAGQVGMNLLQATNGGKGILLGGMVTTPRGNVVVLGAGNAGSQAIDVVASMGANVTVFDLDTNKLAHLQHRYANVTTLVPTHSQLKDAVKNADLLIGAVLVAGARAPVLVDEAMIRQMEPGSVVVDIAVDQGGCIATIEPTTYENPTYERYDVIHFAVTNMPGAVPKTASQALSAAILPYVSKLAADLLYSDKALCRGINVAAGEIKHPALLTP